VFLGASLSALFLGILSARNSARRTAWLGLLGLVYIPLAASTIIETTHLQLGHTVSLRALTEFLALLSALAAWLALRPRRDRVALWAAALGMLALGGLWIGVPWLPRTLMIWSVAMTGFLPGVVYVLALGIWLAAFAALIRHRASRQTALGMALVALGGLRWDFSYYVLLSVTGMLLLCTASEAGKDRGQ
jgi:hypothetical protein